MKNLRNNRWLPQLGSAAVLLLLTACRQDMHNQPKYIPLRASTFWANGQSSRQQVPGTVAQGALRADQYFYTGKNGVMEGDRFPFPITEEIMQRGRARYDVYCAPCHSRVGDGNGMIVQRGYAKAATLIGDERVVKSPVGHYYDVITNGYGAMPDYSSQIPPADRWAISAYVRALQLSQNATVNEVPSELRGKISDQEQLRGEGQQPAGSGSADESGSSAGSAGSNSATGTNLAQTQQQKAPQGGRKK
jgi:Cytochrome C oxidase, cbb3-type, subunit III